MQNAIVFLTLALGTVGCSRSVSPTGPSPSVPVAPVINAAVAVPPVVNTSVATYDPAVTLSGVVSEITASGLKPLEGVTIHCDACGEQGHTWVQTDRSGFYSFEGLWLAGGATPLHVAKDGYGDPPEQPRLQRSGFPGEGWREVTMKHPHMRFDMELVKQ